MKTILIVLLTLLTSTPSFAEKNSPTSVIIKGLDVYAKGGDPKEAVYSWIKGSALEGSKEAIGQSNTLRQIQDYYGKFENYEIVKNHQISKRVHTVLVTMHYEQGPLFGNFQVYRSSSGKWILSIFSFHTQATKQFPQKTVYGE